MVKHLCIVQTPPKYNLNNLDHHYKLAAIEPAAEKTERWQLQIGMFNILFTKTSYVMREYKPKIAQAKKIMFN